MIPTCGRGGWTLVLLFTALLLSAGAARATVTLHFDELPPGSVLNDVYLPQGVRLVGEGGMGPFDVIAREACLPPASMPNAMSLRPVELCPETTDASGWFRATFALSQPRVSVKVTISGPGAATYLRAYHKGGFLEWAFGKTGEAWVGVPQLLEIVQPPDAKKIDYVEFGAFAQGDAASFDDLSFELSTLPTGEQSWGTLKTLFR